MRKLAVLIAFLPVCGLAALAAAADKGDEKKPPEPPAEIKRIAITIFPHQVIVVRGKMVELEDLRDHLAGLVPDAKKAAVEVVIYPSSKDEMDLVPGIIRIAKDAGYRNVTYESPKPVKPEITEITIIISKTGDISVNDEVVAEKDLQAYLEKLVDADHRAAVRVYIRATRLVKMKKVADITKLCQQLGFKDIVFQPIAE